MNLRTSISLLLIFSGAGWAQAQAPAGSNVSGVKTAKPAAVAAPAKKLAKRSAFRPSTKKSAQASNHPASTAVEKESQENSVKVGGNTIHVARAKRDPFESIIRSSSLGNPACGSGKKCLIVGQVVLKGIVKSASGMIAVVENAQKKSYFLRENDPVFNGIVVKIAGDSIVFREKVVDRIGRVSTREIVKKVNSTPLA